MYNIPKAATAKVINIKHWCFIFVVEVDLKTKPKQFTLTMIENYQLNKKCTFDIIVKKLIFIPVIPDYYVPDS